MTYEEKARNYYFSLREKKIEFNYVNARMCIIQAYLDGHVEGEKIGKEKQWKATEKAQKKTSSKIKDLEKENAELKAHCKSVDDVNEKMKCCGNCKHCYEEKYGGLCCNLFDGEKYVPNIEKRDCDKWELKYKTSL